MGLFDRLSKKAENQQASAPVETPLNQSSGQSPIMARLREARQKLDDKDLDGALSIYEEVLMSSGDRADVLVTISGDLGSTGNVNKVIELVAPRYDANRHGPATGINVLQAYLAVRNPDAAQHILDLLFALNRPDLEERLYGFSNAISELMLGGDVGFAPPPQNANAELHTIKVSIVTISKPIWLYGSEALENKIIPEKISKPRRIAFAQLSLPNAYFDAMQEMKKTEDELRKLSKAIPMWLAEAFLASPLYNPITAIAFMEFSDETRLPMIFETEWSTEQLRQMNESNSDPVDYAITGVLKHRSGDYELVLKVWEIKKYRERKQFVARWNPATANDELEKLRQSICAYMECTPVGLSCAATTKPRAWLDSLSAGLSLFLAEKKLMTKEQLASPETLSKDMTQLTQESEAAAIGWLNFKKRCLDLSIPVLENPALVDTSLIKELQQR